MSAGLDQAHIRAAFGRAAATYDASALLQAEVGTRLRERLDAADTQPERVLDVGCGTGSGAIDLRARYTNAEIVAVDIALPMLRVAQHRGASATVVDCVCADAQALAFAPATFDLLHSNLCLQWCEDPGLALAEFRRVLRPGGVLLFSTFGPDTLKELRGAFAKADDTPHVSRFVDMHDIGDALLASGFRDPVLERDDIVVTYRDALALMRDLRAIGATNADAKRQRTLTGKAHLARVVAAYEVHRRDGVLPATYEIIYAHALAPDAGQPVRAADGEVATFPLDRLRGSLRAGG